jgi:hypothetical protein
LTVPLYDDSLALPLAGLCEELEAMVGHIMLEALSFVVIVYFYNVYRREDSIGPIIQKVENVLVKPGWSALRWISFKLLLSRSNRGDYSTAELCEALQSLPDKYLSHLSKLKSVAFNYSAYVV